MKIPRKPYVFETVLRDIQNRSRRRLDLYTLAITGVFVFAVLTAAWEVFGHD
jgi:hypothetical protein